MNNYNKNYLNIIDNIFMAMEKLKCNIADLDFYEEMQLGNTNIDSIELRKDEYFGILLQNIKTNFKVLNTFLKMLN